LQIPVVLTDDIYLEYIITLIKPDSIIHLASISNTEDCEQYPLNTLDINGRVVAVLCDILFRNKIHCKLFNASSSEIYKGHLEYTIQDDDDHMMPTTMYAVCKMTGHKIVDKYRVRYNLPFSNGIIFMTESKLRSEKFLFKKIALHARGYKRCPTQLSLGNLDSWRNINHAEDVAKAIRLIVEQPIGDTYVICSSNFHKVEDLVIDMYKYCNIQLKKVGDELIDIETNKCVIKVGTALRGTITKITGNPEKLRRIGWKHAYTAELLLKELLDMS
jgi:GDPmannose 4,6-dehydratase